jgi:hypothetical protein
MDPSSLHDLLLPSSFATLILSLLSYKRASRPSDRLLRLDLTSKLPRSEDYGFSYIGLLENTGNVSLRVQGVWMRCDDQAEDDAHRLHRMATGFRLAPGAKRDLKFSVDYSRLEDLLRHGFDLQRLKFTVEVVFRDRFFGPARWLTASQNNLSSLVSNLLVYEWLLSREEARARR